MPTRLSVNLKKKMRALAKFKVAMRYYNGPVGADLCKAYTDIQVKLVKLIESVYPVKDILIEKSTTLEAVEKVWPEAGEIVFYKEIPKRNGACKLMDIDEAAESVRADLAQAA